MTIQRMRTPELGKMPRLVYEFDSGDQLTGYMYPTMAREFRAGGAQLAAMFAYDMLETSSRNLGWQTHYLNLVYTPRKAMSAIIAAEAMHRLPRGQRYGPYPQNMKFGPFRVSYEENLAEMVTPDAFLYAGSTRTTPEDLSQLKKIAGYGSSPVVNYEGEGVYFLDRVAKGVWRLEVYPDAVPVRDPFEMQRRDKIVTRAIYRSWPMRISLPDLGADFLAVPVTAGNSEEVRANNGTVAVKPGVYFIKARDAAPAAFPARIGNLAFNEFHAPKPDPLAVSVQMLAAPQYVVGSPMEVGARVVSDARPDSVFFWLRRTGIGWFRRFAMHPSSAYEYRVTIPADSLQPGPHEYVVSVRSGDSTTTFPEGVRRRPVEVGFQYDVFLANDACSTRRPAALVVACGRRIAAGIHANRRCNPTGNLQRCSFRGLRRSGSASRASRQCRWIQSRRLHGIAGDQRPNHCAG